MSADSGILDHGDVVRPGHLRHAAGRVTRIQITPQQIELLSRRFSLHKMAAEIVVACERLSFGPGENVVGSGDSCRDAGTARLTCRAVGDVLGPPEANLSQAIINISSL